MKKSTCNILLWIGIAWLVIVLISFLTVGFGLLSKLTPNIPYSLVILMFFINYIIVGLPGIILIIIAIAKWDSEKEKSLKDKAEVYTDIKIGKIKIKSKGKGK